MVHYRKQDYLSYMSEVAKCNSGISALNDQWENIKLLCEINCPVQSKTLLPAMSDIQSRFYNLQKELVDTLIDETLNKVDQKITSKAQVAVDILIRNLYERTADVGFLATDDDIRNFVSMPHKSEDDRGRIIERLREYVAKYSVYDEIIILDKDFTVLANLDENNPIAGQPMNDPLLAETMNTGESFLESSKASPLQGGKSKAHIFSSKIFAQDSDEVIGILCLCFRFDNEVNQIFKKLSTDYDGSTIMIIDRDNIVIASNDENQVPLNVQMEASPESKNSVIYYRGIRYVSKTVETLGYQEYFGLGWKGHIIIPVNLAFQETGAQTVDDAVMDILMQKADSFSNALKEIISKTQTINLSLKRIIYNGQIIAKENSDEFARLQTILSAIGKIGVSTGRLFKAAVEGLFSTVISTSLTDAGFIASLCIDIMDRNLYERADDCRWWALNSTFRTVLSKDMIDEKDKAQLTKILAYIHNLYTVYSNLFLFDRHGRIIAVSNPERSGDIGKSLNEPYIKNILANARPEKYYVSEFAPTPLYDGRHTYIYGASVTDLQKPSVTVGGIGIVFDSSYQFGAMLSDALKSNENTFAVFADRNGKVISSTGDIAVGHKISLPAHMFSVANGTAQSEILLYNGSYFAVGYACSSGYREYKSTDGYTNDVLAFVFEQLTRDAQTTETAAVNTRASAEQNQIQLSDGEEHEKLVVFDIGNQLFALRQADVLEATDIGSVIKLPGSSEILRGAMFYRDQCITAVNLYTLFHRNEQSLDGNHLLIVQLDEHNIAALEVSELYSVLEVNQSDIRYIPQIGGKVSAIFGILCLPGRETDPILILDKEVLLIRLQQEQSGADWSDVAGMVEQMKNNEDEPATI